MISCFQNAFVPLQKSEIASSSMAFAFNAVERVVERVGHVRGALVANARAAGRVRGCATNAVALLESHKSTRDLHEGGIGPWSMESSECTLAATNAAVTTQRKKLCQAGAST